LVYFRGEIKKFGIVSEGFIPYIRPPVDPRMVYLYSYNLSWLKFFLFCYSTDYIPTLNTCLLIS